MLAHLPAVLITGARAVGKTTTARQHAQTTFDLNDAETLAQVESDPRIITRAAPPVLIDEWQRYPESMNLVKERVDRDFSPEQFILTGTPSVPQVPDIHSGAGRLVEIAMRPMSMAERGIDAPSVSLGEMFAATSVAQIDGRTQVSFSTYAELIARSGLPAVWLAGQTEVGGRKVWRELLNLYVDRLCAHEVAKAIDDQDAASPQLVRRWLRAYAREVATDATFETIRNRAHVEEGGAPAWATANRYRRAVERLGVLEEQHVWDHPFGAIPRTKTSSLRHFVDPALAAVLLEGLWLDEVSAHTARDGLDLNRSFIGRLFQSLVLQSVRVYAGACGANAYWLGTRKNGKGGEREVDIVAVNGQGRVVAIEVKLSGSISSRDCRHLNWLRSKTGALWADGMVVYAGDRAYRREQDDIAVVPAALLGP